MECKRCKSKQIINNGKVRNKQRYNCKSCGFNFVEIDERSGKNIDKQKMAIHLYLENMGFRAIGRVLGVSNVTVLNWIRAAGEWLEKYHHQNKHQQRGTVEVIELDEMWHFIGSKKISYGYGLHWSEEGDVYLTLLRGAGKQQQEKDSGRGLRI
jgi:transposase-like protein